MPRQRHLAGPPLDQALVTHSHAPLRIRDPALPQGRPGLPKTDICNPLVKDEHPDFRLAARTGRTDPKRTSRFTALCPLTHRLVPRPSLFVMDLATRQRCDAPSPPTSTRLAEDRDDTDSRTVKFESPRVARSVRSQQSRSWLDRERRTRGFARSPFAPRAISRPRTAFHVES
jgi:hypothetical protein